MLTNSLRIYTGKANLNFYTSKKYFIKLLLFTFFLIPCYIQK
ncbi:hypothetical protein EMIT0180MI3_340089 [Priestia megaterium]